MPEFADLILSCQLKWQRNNENKENLIDLIKKEIAIINKYTNTLL